MPICKNGHRHRGTMRRWNWNTLPTSLRLDYLIVGGGGGAGGGWQGGGGGAGGLIHKTAAILPVGEYVAEVGSGGAGAAYGNNYTAANGGNSIFNGEIAIGGGRGGGEGSSGGRSPSSGGSGGGGSHGAAELTGAAGTPDQGHTGGDGYSPENYAGGGGGGAGSDGVDATTSSGGNGGAGVDNSITGSSVGYAGGGAGSVRSGTQGTATHGGGGAGVNGSNGMANTGGGGGAGYSGGGTGGTGGSGVVIIRHLTACGLYVYGGKVTTDGDYTVHTFNASGTLIISANPMVPVDSTLELSGASALICTLGDRQFFKRNAGFAIAAYWRNVSGGDYSGPMLVSTVAENVTYYTSYDQQDIAALGSVVYNGVTYYYGNNGQFMGGNPSDTSGTGRVRLTATELLAAVTELLDRYFLNGY